MEAANVVERRVLNCHFLGRSLRLMFLLIATGFLVADGHTIRKPVRPRHNFVWMENEPSVDEDGDDFFSPSDREVLEFRQILLRGLGLKNAPDISKMNVSREEYNRMYANYQEQMRKSKEDHLLDDLDEEDESLLQREKLILTPHSVTVFESRPKSGGRRRDAVRPARQWTLDFRPTFSTLASHQSTWNVESPQLQVRWMPPANSTNGSLMVHSRGSDLKIRVEVLDAQSETVSVIDGDLTTEKWLADRLVVFDLSPNLDDWSLNTSSHGNHSIGLKVVCQGRLCQLLARYQFSVQLQMDLVENALTRTKRSKQLKDILKLDKKTGKSATRASDCSKTQKKCCRQSLKVKFRDLDAFAWIVEPRVADLYMCKGQCKYPHHVANNHALLQGFMHHKDKKKAPKLCCTPSKLEGLKVLYVRDDDPTKLAVAEWDNAVVTECACS